MDLEEQHGAAVAEVVVAAAFGELVNEASACGVEALAIALRATIAPAHRTKLLEQLRRAFTSRSRGEEVEGRIALLARVERMLTAAEAFVADAADREPAAPIIGAGSGEPVDNPVASGGLVDVAGASGHPPAMVTGSLPAVGTEAWTQHIAALVERRDDAVLVELATSFAGSQGKLAKLSGLTEESISRGKSGHRAGGFSETTRAWLQAFLLKPKKPPPPMEKRAGPKAKPGARAPQVWIDKATHEAFAEAAERFGGQSPVLNYLVERYLRRHRAKLIRAPEVPEGTAALRVRIAPELLAELDRRVGGAGARAVHLRAAIAEGMPDLRKRRTLARAA